MSREGDRSVWSKLSRTGGGLLLASIVMTGFVLGVMFPLDISFLTDPLDVLGSMIIYAISLVVTIYFFWWIPLFIS